VTVGEAVRRALGAGVVAGLVRAAWAFGASIASDLGMDSPLRLTLLPIALVGLGAGLVARVRPSRARRLGPVLAALCGAAAGLFWSRATWTEGAAAGALFLLATTSAAVAGGDRPDDGKLPLGPTPLPDEEPPLVG
jgi:hypothetical protein